MSVSAEPVEDDYITKQQIATLLNVSTKTIERMVKEGLIPMGVQILRSRRWKRSEIHEAVAQLQVS